MNDWIFNLITQTEIDAIINVFLNGNENGEVEPETEEDMEAGLKENDEAGAPLSCMTAEEIMQASVGDVVTYGTYGITERYYEWIDGTETEISRSNSETPIEWIVLENDGSSVTLLSKYILDNMPYNYECVPVTWENSDIRAWLNNDFYNMAFNETEKSHIQMTTCVNSDNPYFGNGGLGSQDGGDGVYCPAGGNNTQDKVYLLSLEEIEKYFGVTTNDYHRF